nr:hypothetical protein [Brasilonema sp. UFV-L1]
MRALDAKELPDVPAKEAIRKMRRQIERVLKLGYTYDEVSEVLAGLDIHIGGSRLKYLLGEVRKETRSRNKKKADLTESTETEHFTAGSSVEVLETERRANATLQNSVQSSKQKPQQKPKAQLEQEQPKHQPQPQSLVQPEIVDFTEDYQPVMLRKR